ncbi:MAG: M50 family metallopeptidase [Polyangia bacterium]
MGNHTAKRLTPRGALFLAVLLILALQRLVPFGRQILYPFTLLATWVHEMGHGLTAILVGGRFLKLEIFANAGGIAYHAGTSGVRDALVSAGGLIAPPLVGAVLLVAARFAARPVLLGLAAALFLSVPLWVRTGVGWLTVGGLAALITAVGLYAREGSRLFFAQLLGLLLAFDFAARIDYFFMGNATVGGRVMVSDVGAIAQAVGGPYYLWGGLCAALSGVLLLVGLWAVLRPTASERAALSRLAEP